VVRNKSVLSSVLSHGNEPGVKVIQGVRIEDLVVGTGRRAESGKKVKVHYVGKFKSNDRVFDASKNRPFQFRLGRSEVIQGCVCCVHVVFVGACIRFDPSALSQRTTCHVSTARIAGGTLASTACRWVANGD
jgi:FKBP-type peptidyl-prolyl cis-trans isomerase